MAAHNLLSLRSDPDRTRKRLRKLEKYFAEAVFTSQQRFVCCSKTSCMQSARAKGLNFYKGQLHHLGKHYDLYAGKRPFRIVVAGMSYGGKHQYVSMRRRSEWITSDGLERRPRCAPGDLPFHNPHMSGTTFAVRLALGLGL